MPYVEGPMAEAFLRLCRATGGRSYCRQGEHLLRVTTARFPTLTVGPQFDTIYIRSLLAAYQMDQSPALVPDRRSGRHAGAEPCRPPGRAVPAHLGRPPDQRARHAVEQAADARRDDERAGLARGGQAPVVER